MKMTGVFTLVASMLLVADAALAISVVPELDPGSASMGLALLAGGLLVFRGRRRRR
ncbi:MAG: LPXTG cell wall anchor domain-containing protein [Deltaproteobacteria bacterium]|nr:LPXTG cell wall anchor domain-containing protein [Deltaproteobacteria bacterium]